ncbi:DUF2207 domain-containing protein [Candidatus Gracilibacteria bacterium]|nr:DUF2207 domain-containing protein [Candidatus Gracilibacteria bacterium]
MSKKLVIIVFVFHLFLPSIPAQAQTTQTNFIDIKTINNQNELIINYKIEQTFFSDQNRGIFLSLPKFTKGQWLDYKIMKVVKSSIQNPSPIEEPYSIIHEQNQLRFRIGQKNVFLNPDTYTYNFTIQTNINPNYQIQPTLLQNWTDEVNNITLDNQTICQNLNDCSNATITSNFNTDKPFLNPILSLFNYIRTYIISFVAIILLSYFLWKTLSKDPKSKSTNTSIQLEAPNNLLPWQSHFIFSEGGVDLKKTLISYLLWLNHKKYIQVIPKDKYTKQIDLINISIQKELPKNLLPDIFNKTIESMVDKGLSKGLKSSQINPTQHSGELHKHIYKSLANKYSQKPLHEVLAIWVLLSFFIVVGEIIVLSNLQKILLIGDSWGVFTLLNTIFFCHFYYGFYKNGVILLQVV